jgi:hypothetical protein
LRNATTIDDSRDDGPASDNQHEDERGGHGPGDGDHAGGHVHESEQQVAEDRPGGVAAERERGLQAGPDEGVDSEHDDESQDGDPRPGEGYDPDGEGQQAPEDQRGAE